MDANKKASQDYLSKGHKIGHLSKSYKCYEARPTNTAITEESGGTMVSPTILIPWSVLTSTGANIYLSVMATIDANVDETEDVSKILQRIQYDLMP